MVDELLTWCVVANIGRYRDQQGAMRSKHFTPGTKVWVLPPQWGDGGEDVLVVGRHRGRPGGIVRMVLPRGQLTDFRIKPVYSATVFAALKAPWRDDQTSATLWRSRDGAERVALLWADIARGGSGLTTR